VGVCLAGCVHALQSDWVGRMHATCAQPNKWAVQNRSDQVSKPKRFSPQTTACSEERKFLSHQHGKRPAASGSLLHELWIAGPHAMLDKLFVGHIGRMHCSILLRQHKPHLQQGRSALTGDQAHVNTWSMQVHA